jgi:hypothetical protein
MKNVLNKKFWESFEVKYQYFVVYDNGKGPKNTYLNMNFKIKSSEDIEFLSMKLSRKKILKQPAVILFYSYLGKIPFTERLVGALVNTYMDVIPLYILHEDLKVIK